MKARRTGTRLGMVLAAALVLPACQAGGLFQNERDPINARNLKLERMRLTKDGAEQGSQVKLDLLSGEATFDDPQDGVQTQRYADRTIRQLLEALRDRSWQLEEAARPQRQRERIWRYKLHVQTEGGATHGPVVWHRPAAEQLPRVMKRLENLFSRAQRRMHPLSQSVNLIPPDKDEDKSNREAKSEQKQQHSDE